MSYDWRAPAPEQTTLEWFDEQDRRSREAHRYFSLEELMRLDEIAARQVLEIGVGAGLHAEMLARAGARLTGIDLTQAAVERTRRRFALKGLDAELEQWDAEQPRDDFERRFDVVWSWGVIHHSARTALIVRNVASWLRDDGRFAGMVYHRDSTSALVALVLDGVVRGRLRRQAIDEILWQSSDGFSARFYPAEQWRDLLLAFFEEASVAVTGSEGDVVPLPRVLRRPVIARISPERARAALARRGSFVTFEARGPRR